ncbi:tRNA dihydrouridine synthase DusB [Phosphitispora sp. TUW77]|uniref:tRNA dihydrouridine synthase DusB n=1 Tax=Phosphitispora sp. TUW77 TaxID=3152361 RepID=UPI003AB36A9E
MEADIKFGCLRLANRVISAPMSGISDKAFRLLAEEAGCGLTFTEMISVNALAYDSERTKMMFDLTGEQGPTGIQIFGSDPERMAAAAGIIQAAGASIIDINMGCPAPKVVRNNEGCALMTNLSLAGRIIEAVVKAVDIPVSVKMRKGWDEESVNAVELAKMAEAVGASMVTVHGRTRGQFYSGKADWRIIGMVKQAVGIPVVGNGDVFRPGDAREMIRQTGCDAVMIGRGALGNPWLFQRTVCFLESGTDNLPPSFEDKIKMAIRHLKMVVKLKGEYKAVREMRKHIAWYIKGLKDSSRIRQVVNETETTEGLVEVLQEYRNTLHDG